MEERTEQAQRVVTTMPVDPRQTEAERLWDDGVTKRAIAEHLGVSINTVVGWLPATSAGADQEKRRRGQTLRDAGKSNVEIAEALDISRQRVAQLLGPRTARRPAGGHRTTIVIPPETLARVRAIARQHGLLNESGRASRDGSVVKLLDAIAHGDLIVSKPGQ